MRFSSLAPWGKHFCHLILYVMLFSFLLHAAKQASRRDSAPKYPLETYGVWITILLYFLRCLAFLALPQVVLNFIGLFFFNAFRFNVEQQFSFRLSPKIRIRCVTRGNFPELVCKIVQRNLELIRKLGLENFTYEVVTDKFLVLPDDADLKQIVVPVEYKSKTNALFKARALQYCLEPEVFDCDEYTWIVHLDEETLLTENSVKGILNFVCDGQHQFGQGLVTYANDVVVNWITTTADNFRVADDIGKLRTQFLLFHRPLFSWKGSYVVTNAAAEKDISFDNGRDGSIAEDTYFAMKAYENGYSFNWIEGEMWEKSPFTLSDLLKQRKRWIQGIYLVVHSRDIKFRYKIFLTCSLYAWLTLPLSCLTILLTFTHPAVFPEWLEWITLWIMSVNVYMFVFGALRTFPFRRLGYIKSAFCLIGALLFIPVNIVIENIAVIWAIFSEKHHFYIVDKNYLGKMFVI